MVENVSVKSMQIHYESKHPKETFNAADFEGTASVDPTVKAFVPPPSIKKAKKKEAKAKK